MCVPNFVKSNRVLHINVARDQDNSREPVYITTNHDSCFSYSQLLYNWTIDPLVRAIYNSIYNTTVTNPDLTPDLPAAQIATFDQARY